MLPADMPVGRVVWVANGNAIPPTITTPGGGSPWVRLRRLDPMAPTRAAYSTTGLLMAPVLVVLTTPTPPTTPTPGAVTGPPLNNGMPPGFTAKGWLSYTSALPVMMPKPGVPSSDSDGFNDCPGRKLVLRVQPRLVF